MRRLSRAALGFLLAVSAAVSISDCRSGKGVASRGGGGARDSSFAVLTFQRERSPLDLCETSGRILYDRYCSICHGENGEGDGFNAYNVQAAFGVTPTAFADSAVFTSLNPDSALRAIQAGGPAAGKSPAMPPWGHTLTPAEVVDVWQWVQFLARRGPPP